MLIPIDFHIGILIAQVKWELHWQTMSIVNKGMLIAAAAAVCLLGQTADTKTVPLPLVEPRVIPPGTNPDPLTPVEKGQLALKNMTGPRALGNRLISAGFDQWRGRPDEWGGGMDAFGQRLASRMGRLVVRNSIRLGTDVAMGIDPRYDRCACSGFLPRAGHAWKRVLVSRSDAGNEMPAYSNFTGAYVTPMITYQWYPDRMNTWDRKLQSGTMYLGWRGVSNMLREFWPDVKRGFRRGDRSSRDN